MLGYLLHENCTAWDDRFILNIAELVELYQFIGVLYFQNVRKNKHLTILKKHTHSIFLKNYQ